MTENQTCNGWENKPTWLVKLWIDNDQGNQEYWREVCTEIITIAVDDTSDIDEEDKRHAVYQICLLYTSPSPRDRQRSRMPSSA